MKRERCHSHVKIYTLFRKDTLDEKKIWKSQYSLDTYLFAPSQSSESNKRIIFFIKNFSFNNFVHSLRRKEGAAGFLK